MNLQTAPSKTDLSFLYVFSFRRYIGSENKHYAVDVGTTGHTRTPSALASGNVDRIWARGDHDDTLVVPVADELYTAVQHGTVSYKERHNPMRPLTEANNLVRCGRLIICMYAIK